MKKLDTISIALLTALVVSGCATITTTGPVQVKNENTYVISRKEGALTSAKAPLLIELFTEASNFCLAQGKVMKVTKTHENRGPFTLGNPKEATVTFRCTSESSY